MDRRAGLGGVAPQLGAVEADAVHGLGDQLPQVGLDLRHVGRRLHPLDDAYRERLLGDSTAAIAELGYSGIEGDNMVVVPNTPDVHNMVVCTLCSCYPWPVLGLPPTWYKSSAYRARAVSEPRAVLAEFGLDLPDEVEVRVHDSSAEVRYLVLPMRPAGTEGWGEEELRDLVTRDCMIGVAVPQVPTTTAL